MLCGNELKQLTNNSWVDDIDMRFFLQLLDFTGKMQLFQKFDQM